MESFVAIRPVPVTRCGRVARRAARCILIGVALLFLLAFLIVPLGAIFVQAFAQGAAGYWRAVSNPPRARRSR